MGENPPMLEGLILFLTPGKISTLGGEPRMAKNPSLFLLTRPGSML
ncbi:MAG: hypothetical protein LBF21_02085 [Puniceicoccales bacterium]|nr:hypothetical protein [Puniceicoccales bacterium]